ncbi:MAG TPA: fatty acid desaturase [Ktedonobacteraceae bacterium]|nr:fatty acid desaturase [Ktedonobacteraceae bacterium]
MGHLDNPTPLPIARSSSDYAELKRLIKEAGLLEKHPVSYAPKMALLVAMLALSVLFLLFVHSFWLQLINAAYLAIVTTQLGLLGHDAGHRQVFHTTWKNNLVGLIVGNLLIGMSNAWWMDKHNKHHSHPNQRDLDPDINIPIIAFGEDDLHRRGWPFQALIKYQAYFFFPVLLLVAFDLQINGIQFLFREKVKYAALEWLLLGLHFACYFGLLFSHLAAWQAILFILVHQGLSGFYLGSIFAPNHKGMPVLDADSQMDFLHRQVITARNVRGHPFTDFWYGGLNYQIEHHLFPGMPRNQLKKAQGIIRAFCLAHSIPYYETNWWRSYGEIVQALHLVSAPLRQAKAVS